MKGDLLLMTQTEKVKEYLERNGSITARQAVYDLNIFRLAARIADLKKSGMQIVSETVRKEDGTHYAKYHIVRGK